VTTRLAGERSGLAAHLYWQIANSGTTSLTGRVRDLIAAELPNDLSWLRRILLLLTGRDKANLAQVQFALEPAQNFVIDAPFVTKANRGVSLDA
jgi:hypothetical protein